MCRSFFMCVDFGYLDDLAPSVDGIALARLSPLAILEIFGVVVHFYACKSTRKSESSWHILSERSEVAEFIAHNSPHTARARHLGHTKQSHRSRQVGPYLLGLVLCTCMHYEDDDEGRSTATIADHPALLQIDPYRPQLPGPVEGPRPPNFTKITKKPSKQY